MSALFGSALTLCNGHYNGLFIPLSAGSSADVTGTFGSYNGFMSDDAELCCSRQHCYRALTLRSTAAIGNAEYRRKPGAYRVVTGGHCDMSLRRPYDRKAL